VFNQLREFIPDANIEDQQIHYSAVAVDLINHKEVVFTKGSLYEAIRASIAIPTVFTRVKTENGLLVDGGVLNNIPINHVKRTPNDLVIVVNVNAQLPLPAQAPVSHEKATQQSKEKRKAFYPRLRKGFSASKQNNPGYFDLLNSTINLMMYRMTQMTLESNAPDLLINVSRDACNIFDFHRAEELIEIGRQAATINLKEYSKVEIV